MDQKITDFLKAHRVASLAVSLPDGSPHAAALHYSHQDEPFKIFFSTEKSSRKCQTIIENSTAKAAVVIGFSEEEWVTLQLDGIVEAVKEFKELVEVQKLHYSKHPNSAKYKDDPETLFLAFTPTWWRFTDYNTEPITLLGTDQKS